jgi:histidyl-tRNA synthetase
LIRNAGISADIDLTIRPFKKQLQNASERGYAYVLIIGEEEVRTGKYGLKNLKTQEQLVLSMDAVLERLRSRSPLKINPRF